MIIDIHTHMGTVPGRFQMPLEHQLFAMEKYGIDYALISDIRCGESQTMPDDKTPFQTAINQEAASIVHQNKDRLGLMLWCRPNAEEGFTKEFEAVYLENRTIVKGLKVHPDISGLPFSDARLFPYLEMAEQYGLPVLVHTQQTPFSKVSYVCDMARQFPKVNFILGHMSLSDNKTESFRALAEFSNIYGDTAWVSYTDAVHAWELGLAHKILFGTDSPIAGRDTCGDPAFYLDYYKNPLLPQEVMENLLFKNAQKLFSL